MANYIDQEVYDAELRRCKREGELSVKFLEMFQIHCFHVGKRFYLDTEYLRQDAIATCVHDILRYWQNFNVDNCCAIKLLENYRDGDQFEILIVGKPKITITFSDTIKDHSRDIIQVGKNANGSNRAIYNLLREKYADRVRCTVYTTQSKLTMIDTYNGEDPVYSQMKIKLNGRPADTFIREDKYQQIEISDNVITVNFVKSSNAFAFLTSLITNSIIGFLDVASPRELRGGNRVPIAKLVAAEGEYD